MPTQKKIDTVKKIKEKLEKAKAFFVTEYQGLTHQQLETLRKSLKKTEADFVVAKNRLLKIALGEQTTEKEQKEKIEQELTNPTATFFAYKDEIAAVKTLADFIKNYQLPKIKIGLFEGKITLEADFKKLATLPSREILLSTLLARLNLPITNLHYGLKWNLIRLATALTNIKNKK